MPAHRIFFHLTWSTLARRPMINAPTRAFLDEYFRKIALQERATIVCLGFLQTHAHLLIRTGPRFDLPRLVQLLKGGSSYAASRQPGNVLGLRWSREYSVTSVSPKTSCAKRSRTSRVRTAATPPRRSHRDMDGKGNGHSLSLPISHAVGVGPALHCASSAVLHWAHSSEWEHPSTRGDVGNIPPSRSHAAGAGPIRHCASSAVIHRAHCSRVGITKEPGRVGTLRT
jgi:REP element-mobilizing transposase RayT